MNQRTANYKGVLSGIFLILIIVSIIISLYLFVVANDNQETIHATHTQTIPKQELTPIEQEIKQCLQLTEQQDSCLFNLCTELREHSYLCAEDLLDIIVKIEGPEEAMEVLGGIMESSLFDIQTDGHQLAHVIGRVASRYFGLSPESFARCPLYFDRGCQHGFFQGALERENHPVRAGIDICGQDSDCYHGVGHGFIFETSYNLMDSLHFCDQLSTLRMQEHCYAGVFMENMNGFFAGVERKEMGFVENDLLAPCSWVEDRYYRKCWVDHGRFLLYHHEWSLQKTMHFCLEETESHTHGCMLSLGWIITLMEPRRELRESFEGTPLETVIYLCNQFPPEYIDTCQLPNVIEFISRDGYDLTINIIDFCLSLHSHTGNCFKIVGEQLIEFLQSSTDEALQSCGMAPEEYRADCYEGAGIDPTLTRLPIV